MSKTCFATVGTTEFDHLVRTMCADETLTTLRELDYGRLRMQIGRGQFTPPSDDEEVSFGTARRCGVVLEWYRYKESIRDDLIEASLVVSHAGAGTCLEALELRPARAFVVAINETLMNNHQLELARRLRDDGHLVYCTPDELVRTLRGLDGSEFRPWSKGEPAIFAGWLDSHVGFASKATRSS